jgi:hypothetical protein
MQLVTAQAASLIQALRTCILAVACRGSVPQLRPIPEYIACTSNG